MAEIILTKKQARQLILLKQGLIGKIKFAGKQGILDYISQAGCIQFDPIDVCGKNAELVLQSRVKGFKKSMLEELLYKDRLLIDYFDKNMSIYLTADWQYFGRWRRYFQNKERSLEQIQTVEGTIKEKIAKQGPLCSADLAMNEKVDWYWSSTRLARAALEHMYFCGDLVIHHKKGTIKYYDLVENCLPVTVYQAKEPFSNDGEYMKWLVLRRIGAVGMLWNKASDAWLGISGLTSAMRTKIFSELLSENKLIALKVEGIKETLYCQKEDMPLIDQIKARVPLRKHCALIAPLDNMMWDRKLIKVLFDFDYKWEIYTPQAQRKYGYYVLPILYGDRLIGRIETIFDRKINRLEIKQLWYEKGIRQSKALETALNQTLKQFEKFNQER